MSMKVLRGLGHFSDRLRKSSLLSLKMRRLWGDLIVAFQYLDGAYKKERKGLLSK